MKKYAPHIGLRTIKTALAVVVSMLVASLFGPPSIFPALSAIAVMRHTFQESLQECKNQAVGICIGGILGCVTVLLYPSPPIWIMGLGVIVIILLCTTLHVTFSCSLSLAIFIVACMTDRSEVVTSTLTRLFHTGIGLGIGLAINYLIVPYDNSSKIYALLRQVADCLPLYLDACMLKGLNPDLGELDGLLARLHDELAIYHHQRFQKRARHKEEYVYMSGCVQLAERIQQELTALCCLDSPGFPDQDNRFRLRCLNLKLPERKEPAYHSSEEDDTVTNYHLRKLLEACAFLLELLDQRAWEQKRIQDDGKGHLE